MKKTNFKPILNKEKYIAAFKEQSFPQIGENLELALNTLYDQGLITNKNGTINKIGQETLRRAMELNNGVSIDKIAKELKGLGDETATEQEIKDSFVVLGVLAYFVKGGPKLFKAYLDHNKNEFSKEALDNVLRQEGRHKVYEAEVNLNKVKEEMSEKLK